VNLRAASVPTAGNHSEFQSNSAQSRAFPWEDTTAVAVLSRWSGGDRQKFIASAKKVKLILDKLGAEVRAGQISTGPHAGQWVTTARFADWESFGKGVQELLNDPSYLKLVGEMEETFKLENRTIITGIDL
jgi:hypothetical protein